MVAVKRKPLAGEEIYHPFGEMMAQRRKEMNISLQCLSDKIGSGSRQYMRDIEKGKYAVSVELGLAICQILNIPMHLCLDFIASVEIRRIQKNIKDKYNDWVEYVPDNVLKEMTSDESSSLLHDRLITDSTRMRLKRR